MPRTALTKTTGTTPYPTAGVPVTWNTADVVSGNAYPMTGHELVLVRNAHATDPKTVTIGAVACSHGRSGAITALSIVAGVTKMFGPFKRKEGWVQTDGMMYIDGESTDIKIAVVMMPALV